LLIVVIILLRFIRTYFVFDINVFRTNEKKKEENFNAENEKTSLISCCWFTDFALNRIHIMCYNTRSIDNCQYLA